MRMSTTMRLFQAWRRITGRPTHEKADPKTATIEDLEAELIKERCDEMRPHYTWEQIANTLGITKKTLAKKRKKYNIHPPKPRLK